MIYEHHLDGDYPVICCDSCDARTRDQDFLTDDHWAEVPDPLHSGDHQHLCPDCADVDFRGNIKCRSCRQFAPRRSILVADVGGTRGDHCVDCIADYGSGPERTEARCRVIDSLRGLIPPDALAMVARSYGVPASRRPPKRIEVGAPSNSAGPAAGQNSTGVGTHRSARHQSQTLGNGRASEPVDSHATPQPFVKPAA